MKARKRASIEEGLPPNLPSLHRAHRLQDRAAGVGFDWPDVDGPAAKVDEELGEVRAQLRDHPIERTPQARRSTTSGTPPWSPSLETCSSRW
jgi:uncharacterized protein YabN with tetrapyrrole methylase and pyrophosphatase domain